MSTGDLPPLRDEDLPIVKYEIVLSGRPLLSEASPSDSGGGLEAEETVIDSPVPEEIVGEIKWDRHIDEVDKLDYVVAISSGVISGLVDVFFVGEFSFDKASEWGKEHVEAFVKRMAKVNGYKGDGLDGAVKWLEDKFHLASDGATPVFGGGLQHHFRDFAHHFSIGGLMCSIFTQFTGLCIGCDARGNLKVVPVPESHRQYLGRNFHEKLAFGIIKWFFHMVSDMAGSSGAIMGGTGIPGPLVSFMKELSTLPFFKDSVRNGDGFRQWLSKLFNGTLLERRDEAGKAVALRFDLRAEVGIMHEAGKQALPVLINQCVVRGFYFVRRTCREIKELEIESVKDLDRISPEDVLPFNNGAVRRMVSVSSGVFVGVDFADAAVRAYRAQNPAMFFLRINYVGVASFAVACYVDARASMAAKRLEEGESAEEAYERRLSDLGCLTLNVAQSRILHSLERAIVSNDIDPDKHVKRNKRKKQWLEEWSGRVASDMSEVWPDPSTYFLDEGALYDEIARELSASPNRAWLYLVAMEAFCFEPYIALHGENDKDYKNLRYGGGYLAEAFCERRAVISAEELKQLEKGLKRARKVLGASSRKKAVGAVGAVVVIAVTGGVAFYFAPAIAPALAGAMGAEVASLSGAALTSASLAFLGGGALAAGGAGMAGGTALIVGGGALIGAVGGTGASTITVMALATDGGYVYSECSKLLAFCSEVLIGKLDDEQAVLKIQSKLNRKIVELEVEVDAIKRRNPDMRLLSEGADTEEPEDGEEELSQKRMIKILNRSLKYLKRCNDELARMVTDKRKREAKQK